MIKTIKDKEMCRSADILETIKKTKGCGGMTKSQIMLAEAHIKDIQAMRTELKSVKTDIADLKTDVAGINGKIDILLKQSESKPVLQIVKELINSKGFWIVLALIVIGIYGIDLTGLRDFI